MGEALIYNFREKLLSEQNAPEITAQTLVTDERKVQETFKWYEMKMKSHFKKNMVTQLLKIF